MPMNEEKPKSSKGQNMTALELGDALAKMYRSGEGNGSKTTMIHLFGIRYASEIEEKSITALQIVKAAGISNSYVTEVYKGIRLAKFVKEINDSH